MKIRGLVLAVVLTATLGKIEYMGHSETWYDLPMDRLVTRAQDMGIPADYWIREDGVKMFGPWVIVAGHKDSIRFSRVPTSLGEGIILDKHCVDDPNLYDIATDWKE